MRGRNVAPRALGRGLGVVGCCLLLAAASAMAQYAAPAITAPAGAQTAAAPATPQSFDVARKVYADTIRANYNYRFGKDKPFMPSNASIEGNDFIQPGAFPNAKYCAHCHEEAYHQWRQALHSNAFRDPFYQTSVQILIQGKGIEYSRHCDSCHNPIAVLSGALTQNSPVDRKFNEDGVTCMVCHSIQGLKSTSGNGGYIMGVPSVMVDENGKRIPGEVPYYQILANPKRHSAAVMQSIYRTPQFCASCHQANLPQSVNDYKFLPAFSAYDEWQNSKFSQQNPLTFYSGDFTTCQGCHMKRSPNRFADYGAKNGTFASHRWLAGNTAVPFYYEQQEELQKTVEFLQAGNYLNVDIVALKKKGSPKIIAPLGTVPFRLEANSTIQAFVVIQNKNIGHSLIPEVRDLYEAWVEFQVQDASGHEISHSGFLKPDGMLDERAHSFTNRPVNAAGEFVDNHMVWTIHSVAYDNTIQAGRSALVRYEFQIPADLKGPLTMTARVNYRHLRQSYLNNSLGPKHPLYPVVVLASQSRTLNVGENDPIPAAATDNPDWMRWNNLGIGYLDQQQYPDAVRAFRQVVRLRPTYADAYINIALTEFSWQKYGSARINLIRALQLSPNNARALYYRGLLERRTGHSDAELADLQSVVAQYPMSRDARRELGITYYQRENNDDAIQQFEALQAIDPDDLAAHYNLSILYRRIGKPKQAADQQALFVTEKYDPDSPTYSYDFLQKHPEITTESIPWHVHRDVHGGQDK